MRCSRSSISRSSSAMGSVTVCFAPAYSPAAVRTSVPRESVTDSGEDVLERVTRGEPGGRDEAAAVERAGILHEVDGARWHVVQPELEQLAEDEPSHGLGDGQC